MNNSDSSNNVVGSLLDVEDADDMSNVTSGVHAQSPGNHATDDETETHEETHETAHEQAGFSGSNRDEEAMRKDFFKDIRGFGRTSGERSTALLRLYARAVRAAADGLISNEKPQGGGKDDAAIIYEAYTAEDSKKAEHTLGGAKANASKLRQVIGLGCLATIDGVEICNKAVAEWERMTGAELKPKPLAAGIVDVARAQLGQDTELSDAQITDALSKTPSEKTLEKEWKAINKRIENLITGEGPQRLKDESGEAFQIHEMVAAHVSKFETNNSNEEFIKICMARGFTRDQAEEMASK